MESLQLDAELESKLNDYIHYGQGSDELNDILSDVTENTPLHTRFRAEAYRILDTTHTGEKERGLQESFRFVEQARAYDDADVRAEAKCMRGEVLLFWGEMTEALALVPLIEKDLRDVINPRIKYHCHSLIGRILRDNSQFELALEHFLHAYESLEGVEGELASSRRQLINLETARLQVDLQQFDSALRIVERTVERAKREEYYRHLPNFFLVKGYIQNNTGQQEASIETHREAIRWAEEVGDLRVQVVSRNNIGSALIDLEQLDEAREILQEGYDLAEGGQHENIRQTILFNLGHIDVQQGNVEAGLEQIERSRDWHRENESSAAYEGLLGYVARVYASVGDYEKQAQALLEQREVGQELFRSEREEALSEMQARYEAQEQARQIELLEQRNALQERVIENAELQQRIVLLFIVVVILGAVTVLQAYRAARKANVKLNEANEKLKYQSLRDPLTGLNNRRALQQAMEDWEKTPTRRAIDSERTDAFILLDLDFFKQINDVEGHAAGDVVLMEIAARLKSISRTSDSIVRWGGEEFLIYLKETDPKALPVLAERILEAVGGEPVVYQGREIPITVTGGYITLPFAGIGKEQLSWEKTLQLADMALYIGKVHGRNQVKGITALNVPFEEAQEALETDLAEAVNQGWVDIVTVEGPGKAKRVRPK